MNRAALFAVTSLLALGGAWSAPAAETGAQRLFHRLTERDVDVLTVTDVTDAGRKLAPPSPARPVRFKLIYLGEVPFGPSWAGEQRPSKKASIDWILAALKSQGYLLADAEHPPEILCLFGWGMMQGGDSHAALRFLGGEKVNLMWEQEGYSNGMFNPVLTGAHVLVRDIYRTPLVAQKVWDFSGSDLFLGSVRAFTIESEFGLNVTSLWETRFGCPATGLAMSDAMPLMIKAAAASFGRETERPVNVNATEAFGGHVELGELQVLGTAEDTKAHPRPAKETGEEPVK